MAENCVWAARCLRTPKILAKAQTIAHRFSQPPATPTTLTQAARVISMPWRVKIYFLLSVDFFFETPDGFASRLPAF